ncbi:MAG: cytochrome c oxidase subunit 3 [Phycisphaeraceae bacterium]
MSDTESTSTASFFSLARRPAGVPHVVPPGTHALGMWLFLAALAVLFVAGMLAYVIVRIMGTTGVVNPVTGESLPPTAPPLHTLDIPLVLWLSTGAILLSSYTIHRAVENIVHERQDRFRQALIATILLSVPFFLAQFAGLATLLGRAGEGGTPLQYAIFVLIVIHGLHVVGGMIPLAVITRQAHAGRYDHEYHAPVKSLALYWHFLDAVWLIMFATFLVLG